MDNCCCVPILFIVFNRLDTTQIVFEEIKKVKPKKLLVAADGPRQERVGEKEKCEEVRKYILDNISWKCEVKTLFREKNLGCGRAVSSAINWFFKNVEQGIILEDDCLPNTSFFKYCQKLLEHYKNEKKVMHIAGVQFAPNKENGPSYYFARLMHCWGWASWADRWKQYQFDLKDYDEKNIEKFSPDKNVQGYWLKILDMIKEEKIDTWDYQWTFKIVEKDGLCINPSINLVSNIGYGGDSTHTFDKGNPNANLPTFDLKEIIHPKKVELDWEAINYIYKHHIGIDFESKKNGLLGRIRHYFKKNGE